MTPPDERPLLMSTLQTATSPKIRVGATVPCLTLACHPDPRRIGERAILTPLLVRQPALLSRAEPRFAAPGGSPAHPLADPYLSRKPLRIVAGPTPGSVAFEGLPKKACIDGQAATEGQVLDAEAIRAGVVVQLSSRIVLLLHATSGDQPTEIEGLLGHSDGIEAVRKRLRHVAPLDIPVLVQGETGVGKECVARAIHALSVRAEQPFVAVNMATLGDQTAGAALFGHARGAFTGALSRHRGFFERASGGTLFLDEVADTPTEVQPMLLRALEAGAIQPLGDEQERPVDVRVVAATDGELDDDSPTGSFRAALKHRLSGYEIRVPALRRRPEDIPQLLLHFLSEELHLLGREDLLDARNGDRPPPLAGEAIARLLIYDFPGNVRELRNVARLLGVELMAADHVVLSPELEGRLTNAGRHAAGDDDSNAAGSGPGRRTAVGRAAERQTHSLSEEQLLAALEVESWSPQRTAGSLGIATSTLHYMMQKAGIRRATDFSDDELREAAARWNDDLHEMARALKVSPRALKLTLTRRGLD